MSLSVDVPQTANDRDPSDDAASARWRFVRFAPFAIVVVLTSAALVMGWQHELSIETLALHYMALEAFVAAHGPMSVIAFVAIYIGVVTLSIPGGIYLTITGGLLFGVAGGTLASFTGAVSGATVVFLLARTAFADHLLRRGGPMVERLAEGFREDAFSYLLFLRLVPVFPFFLVNLVPALAGVRLAPFVAATAIGIIPAVIAFTLIGSGLDSVISAEAVGFRDCIAAGHNDCRIAFDINNALTPHLFAALAGLGVLALIPVALKRLRARRLARPAD